MTRPQKQTVDYFPHFVAKGKTKLILQNEFGNDGYAFWYHLLELLCVSEKQVYDYNNPAAWRLLLAETHVPEDIAVNILQLLADLGTIDSELHRKKIIWSQNLVENLEAVYRRRSTGIPERPVIVNNNPVIVNNNPHSKQYNTKQNKSKQEGIPLLSPNGDFSPSERKFVDKKPYGEFNNVLLSSEDYSKLQQRFASALPEKIEALSIGIASKGLKFKSHYATILSWDNLEKKRKAQSIPGNRPDDRRPPGGKYHTPEEVFGAENAITPG